MINEVNKVKTKIDNVNMSLSIFHQFLRRVVFTQSQLVALRSKNVNLIPCCLIGRQYHSNKLCAPRKTRTAKVAPVISFHQFSTHNRDNNAFNDESDTSDSNYSEQSIRHKVKRNVLRPEHMEAEEYFKEMMTDIGMIEWTVKEWAEASKVLTPKLRNPWDIVCMKTLFKTDDILMGKSLMSYLNGLSTPVNTATMAYYISLLGRTCSGNKEQEDLLWKCYQSFMSEHELLDTFSADLLMEGLCHTCYYTEGVSLIERQREFYEPDLSLIVHLLLGALRHNDTQLCKEQLHQLTMLGVDPLACSVHVPRMVEACLNAGNISGLDLTMDCMEKHGVLMDKTSLNKIIAHFHNHQPGSWTARYGYIHNRGGNCVVCGHLMDRPEVTDTEFEALRDVFLDQVIVAGNVFFRSSPDEVQKFCKFVANNGPFDVVIDGLNIMLRHNKPKFDFLESAISHYADQGYRILVLGNSMLKPHLGSMSRIHPKPFVYLASSTKADDVFYLYAALYSGKSTVILTRDKLRDHRFKLKPELRAVFSKWLHTVQVYDWFIARSGYFVPKPGRSFSVGPSCDAGGWHFPQNDLTTDPFGKLSVLCLRKKSSPTLKIGRPRKQTKLMYQRQEQIKKQHLERREQSEKEWFES